jgi:hypothetical protein
MAGSLVAVERGLVMPLRSTFRAQLTRHCGFGRSFKRDDGRVIAGVAASR